MTHHVETFFDKDTSTFTYVIVDPASHQAAIVDAVLNFEPNAAHTATISADEVIAYIKAKQLTLTWLLETHIHADHLSAAHYIRDQLGGRICIGANITHILDHWVPLFNTAHDTPLDGSQFDHLLQDQQIIKLGNLDIKTLYTPGHTSACVSYLIEDDIFVGDLLFMPDVGTSRTDFPGGDTEAQYDSIQRIFDLPENTRIFTCHDYPETDRPITAMSTVGDQKRHNILVNDKISKSEYIAIRNKRNQGKGAPHLLFPSVQHNLRAGSFGEAEPNGVQYIKVPVNRI